MVDYHLHTSRCCHAVGTMDEYLAEAELKKIREIGFADHFPLGLLDYNPRVQVTMNPGELDEYILQVENLKKLSNRVKIKLGIEIDYLPGTEDKLGKLLKEYSFDFVIGSIHFMDDWDFTHPVYADTYKDRDLNRLYETYFDLVWNLCHSGLIDIIGHIDVIKKFGYRPSVDLEPLWEQTARILKQTDTCMELNTAGRDAPVGEFYPEKLLIEKCFKEGVSVTLGSDAHGPQQVGRYFEEALQTLKEAGYRELTVFEKRIKSSLPLD
ncbi:MAG: histidinol-phosphatase HisJ family protein [Bacillota bacterium]